MFARGGGHSPNILLALGASNFIYVALTDLVPELHEENEKKKSLLLLLAFVLGILAMAALLMLEK